MATKRDTANQTARARARKAVEDRLKARRERDARIEAAVTDYFTAIDALDAARVKAGGAVAALLDEGETRSDIADMLGASTREIREFLTAADGGEEEDQISNDDGDDTGTDSSTAESSAEHGEQ